MFCGKCGAENATGAKFCKECGQPLENKIEKGGQVTQNMAVEKTAQSDAKKVDVSQLLYKIKSLPKNIFIGMIAGVAALVVIICVMLNAASTINLDKYVTIETTGYDGYGTVKASIDWDSIEKKYGDKISIKTKTSERYGGFLTYMTPIEILKDCIDVEFNEKDNLSNGDKLEYSWRIEDYLTEYVKCKVKAQDGTYTVSGLEEVGKFDAFADLKVSFEGIAPSGKISYDYTGEQLGYYDFSCSATSGLSNGDTVIISINNTDMAYYAQKYGMVPDKLEKEYVVSGLNEYVSSYSKISSDYISELKSKAEDTIYAHVANNYNSTSSLTDLQYSGYIFNFIKDVNGYFNSYNNIYIIYSGTVSNSDGEFGTTKVYFPVRFANILSGDAGFSYDYNDGIVGYSSLGDSWYRTNGYINPLTCYIEIVEDNSDKYTAECGDGFEDYADYELISGLSDISDDYKEVLYADAIKRIEDYIASDYNDDSEAADLKTIGEYLLLTKTQGTDLESNNKYVVVCSATVSDSNGRFDTTTVYFPVEYDGLVKLPGDEYMFISAKGISGSSNFSNSWYRTKGYINGTEMYSKVVTANRENYKYEVSDSLKEFGE